MDPLARNERLKLTANALDRASTSFLTIGVLAPVAASIYGMGPAIPSLPIVIASGRVWLFVRVHTTLDSEGFAERSAVMTTFQVFAVFVLPVLVTAVAVISAFIAVRSDQRRDRMHPGE